MTIESPGPWERFLLGARNCGSLERAAFGALTSFAATVASSRAINYVRERRRPFPRLRSLTRRVSTVSGSGVRFHHFLPGIGVAYGVGGTAVLTHRRGFWLSLPFGSGVALTLDELALLLGADDAYWGSERLALVQAAAAAASAAALMARFYRRGLDVIR